MDTIRWAAICAAGAISGTVIYGPAAEAAPLEPPGRGILIGVNLAWGEESIHSFNKRIGIPHVSYVDFSEFPLDSYRHLQEHVDQVAELGAIYLLTLEPMHGLESVTAQSVEQFADQAAAWRASGARIMIRFAHEMNGGWYPWSMRPALYRSKFRLLADALHRRVPDGAMVWAPNEGGDYPFWPYQNMSKEKYLSEGHGTEADWALLDTNGDGILQRDDPYAPFYPGDDAVDWVGMTIYHWGSVYPWHFNTMPESNKFAALLTGNYTGPSGDHTWAPNFYAIWAVGHNKPMMIPETSAYFRPGIVDRPLTDWPPFQSQDETAIKNEWLSQIFGEPPGSIAQRFPRLRMINWFNHFKRENEAEKDWVDWTVTRNQSVLARYRSVLRHGIESGQLIELSAWQRAFDKSNEHGQDNEHEIP